MRWIGWTPGDGYGDATLQYLTALDGLGVPLTWTPVERRRGDPSPHRVENYAGPLAHLAARAIGYDAVVVHVAPDRAAPWLTEAADCCTVSMTTWETDRLPFGWDGHLAPFDAVIVPSTFNLTSLVASGCQTPAHVVPHIARSIGGVQPASFERIGDRFLFYAIAPWSTRKALAETVMAFLDAFDADDDVALLVKTSADDHQAVARARRGERVETAAWKTFASLLAGRRHVPEVQLIAGHVPASEIDALHNRGDCFVSLARSEGWGLCIADAVLAGNPVVITGWGGQLDYLGADYPLLVDYDLIETSSEPDDGWFDARPGYRWARARHDHAVDLMRWVAANGVEAAALAAPVRKHLASECAPDVIGRRLLEVIESARP